MKIFSMRLIRRIKRKKTHQGETKERFIYNFIAEFMSRDQEILMQYEKILMRMEEDVMQGKIENFQRELMPIRRKLLTLRGYYDEMMDMGTELEENENGFFAKKQLKYFGDTFQSGRPADGEDCPFAGIRTAGARSVSGTGGCKTE